MGHYDRTTKKECQKESGRSPHQRHDSQSEATSDAFRVVDDDAFFGSERRSRREFDPAGNERPYFRRRQKVELPSESGRSFVTPPTNAHPRNYGFRDRR